MSVRAAALVAMVVAVTLGAGHASAQESKTGEELRHQGDRLAEDCGTFGGKQLVSCAATVVTDHPFHLATGSVAPQNGFGFGLAFVAPQSKPNDDWRINWSTDFVGTSSGAWRAGVYSKFVNTHVGGVTVTGPGGGTPTDNAMPRPYPTYSIFAQTATLPTLSYFGLGNDSTLAAKSIFRMRQSTFGGRVVWPFAASGFVNRLNPAAIGEANGRWVEVVGASQGSTPSIATLYTDDTAPGLTSQPATLQFGESVRIAPALGRLQIIYTAGLEQYVAASNSAFSFRRWTIDLEHEFSLWTTTRTGEERESNSPNECATSDDRTVGVYGCPDPVAVTTNRVGAVSVRALLSKSSVSHDSRVPFYFQRTLGGSDIDGERLLASYDDYRFRGPNILVLQETFEHVLWGPLGAFVEADQGRVGLVDQSLTSGLRHTFGAGLTGRVGGVPVLTLWWATGGPEGHHIAATMNTSLLGGSARPSLQ